MKRKMNEPRALGAQRTFSDDAREAAFLLGGIGTGTISLTARGEFTDWEIFNRPAKGNKAPYGFFCIWAKPANGMGVARVLEARLRPPYAQAHGYHSGVVAGLPRLASSRLRGEYPFVWIDFEDAELPVAVQLEAFNPFIPLNAEDSGIPGAVIRYKVRNTSAVAVDVTVAGSVPNLVGFRGYDLFDNMLSTGNSINELRRGERCNGIYGYSLSYQPRELKYGSIALLTSDANVTVKPNWLKGGWWDGAQEFWDDFSADGRLEAELEGSAAGEEPGPPQVNVGSLGVFHTILPNEEKVFEFVLAWYFPNRVRSWDEDSCTGDCEVVRNYYGRLFADAWDVGKHLIENMEGLEGRTRDFHRALFGSTLPSYVLDALASNITALRSNTCFRIEDGTFLAYEGCHNANGSCAGTCTHVWNYAQTVAFLFPDLERSARELEFNLETDEDGSMAFRTWRIFGKQERKRTPAADGQMGTIVRLYREWKLSGDDEFLERVWSNACKALDFAFRYWDSDGDCVLDSQQHNTYDIDFYGPNSFTSSIFLAALKAGAEMAEYLGDREHASKYRSALEVGSKRMDELLWDGEYYVQKLSDVNEHKYQYGIGCLSDQVFGQFLAHVAGLGYILPPEHVRKALESVYRHNFKRSFEKHQSVQRAYALNDESGLVLCTWPKGGRPRLPFVYSDEVWTGIEYQVAAHLIFEGYIEKGLEVVKAVRDRHDGFRRNPWDEVECGHHYARSMASWGVLIALSGFKCDMVRKRMSFDPKINKDAFTTFWSTGKAWGIFTQKRDDLTGEMRKDIEVIYGSLDGVKVD